ncbi:MAG: ice-binding family protein, partial [Balneolales bacterium]
MLLATSCGVDSNTDQDPSDTDKPTVVSSDPADNTEDIQLNKIISVTFSEVMDPSTINATTVTLKNGTTSISGVVEYAGTTATFSPENHLQAETSYTIGVTTGARGLSGNDLESFDGSVFTTGGNAEGLEAVNTGSAGDYVILAKTAVTNVPTSAITGDMGLSPEATSSYSGFDQTDATGYAESAQVTGKMYAADMADPTPINLTTAVENMLTAYDDAAGRPTPDFIELNSGDIGGLTLSPALYNWSSTVTIPGDVVLNGGADDVWIFQIAGDLTMSSAVNVTLTGGAKA